MQAAGVVKAAKRYAYIITFFGRYFVKKLLTFKLLEGL